MLLSCSSSELITPICQSLTEEFRSSCQPSAMPRQFFLFSQVMELWSLWRKVRGRTSLRPLTTLKISTGSPRSFQLSSRDKTKALAICSSVFCYDAQSCLGVIVSVSQSKPYLTRRVRTNPECTNERRTQGNKPPQFGTTTLISAYTFVPRISLQPQHTGNPIWNVTTWIPGYSNLIVAFIAK